MSQNRRESYEDYCREIDEEAEKKAHDDNQCDGLPLCPYCLDDWEERNCEELDLDGYWDWVK